MEFRLAKPKDLSEIQTVYHLIEHMSESNIVLWDKEPPNGALADDIEAGRLFVTLMRGEYLGGSFEPFARGSFSNWLERLRCKSHLARRPWFHAADYGRPGIGMRL